MHHYFKYLLIALASALASSYAVLWFVQPSPLETTTIPPLILKEQSGELVLWGGWKTVEGYQSPGLNAVEVRCNRKHGICSEAFATILRHDAGEDLEAQAFHYHALGRGKIGSSCLARDGAVLGSVSNNSHAGKVC